MWGRDGTGLPSCRTSTPTSYRAPASSSAETNWLDADASIVTDAAATTPRAAQVNGSDDASWSMSTPSARRAPRISPIGRRGRAGRRRTRPCPSARAATGGTKRITVPASPQSTVAGPRSGAGRHPRWRRRVRSTSTPSDCSACDHQRVSRASSGRCRCCDGPSAIAARRSARLVIDFEPGTARRRATGRRLPSALASTSTGSVAAAVTLAKPTGGPGRDPACAQTSVRAIRGVQRTARARRRRRARAERRAWPARRGSACPRCRRWRAAGRPVIETFLKKWICWFGLALRVGLLPEPVTADASSAPSSRPAPATTAAASCPVASISAARRRGRRR